MSQLKLQLQQRMKLQQTLKLTPQLQLAMKMLQMNHLELSELIKQEVEQNPLLETGESADTSVIESPSMTSKVTESSSGPGDMQMDATAGLGAPSEKDAKPKEKDFYEDAWIKYQMENQDGQYAGGEGSGGGGVNYDPDEESNLEEYVSSKPSLTEHLHNQLRVSELNDQERKAGEYLIGLIDRNGYLIFDEASVMVTLGITPAQLLDVVDVIQSMDPPGIGARNVTECLVLQYQTRTHPKPLVEILIQNHLEDLANNRVKQIAAKEKVSVDEVLEAYKEIRTLDPRPGLHYDVSDRPQYITPDVFVEKINLSTGGEEIKVTLNDKYVPQLRINQFYQAQLRTEKVANKDTISYIKDKLNAARFIMESIERRKDTIFRVTKEIFAVQTAFFEEGVKGLHQLTLKKIADKLGLHESTISRVTNSKWVHTPRGVFQLKFFFSSGTTTSSGEDISSKHIKELVQEVVASEEPRRPYSDAKIRSILKARGIDIARRTVTKYREELGIRSSSKRKTFA